MFRHRFTEDSRTINQTFRSTQFDKIWHHAHFAIPTVKVVNISIRPSSFPLCLGSLPSYPCLPPYLQTSMRLFSVTGLVCIFWNGIRVKSYNIFFFEGGSLHALLHIMEIYPEMYPCFYRSLRFVAGCQALHCQDVSQVVYPFTCRKTLRLLAGFEIIDTTVRYISVLYMDVCFNIKVLLLSRDLKARDSPETSLLFQKTIIHKLKDWKELEIYLG